MTLKSTVHPKMNMTTSFFHPLSSANYFVHTIKVNGVQCCLHTKFLSLSTEEKSGFGAKWCWVNIDNELCLQGLTWSHVKHHVKFFLLWNPFPINTTNARQRFNYVKPFANNTIIIMHFTLDKSYKVHPALNTDCYCNYSSDKWKRKTLTTGSPAKYFVFFCILQSHFPHTA